MSTPLDCFSAAETRDPNGGMRLLQGSGPHVDIADLVVLALKTKGASFGPCPNNQLMGFTKSLNGVGGIHSHRVILTADPPHEAGDDAATTDYVQHGDLLGDPQGMVAQG